MKKHPRPLTKLAKRARKFAVPRERAPRVQAGHFMLLRVVRVSGLASRPDLDGVVGIATHFQQERNRYSVTFPTAESLSVAAERLERADVPDEPTPALMLVHREAFHMRLRWRRAEHVAGRYNTPLDDLQADVALAQQLLTVPSSGMPDSQALSMALNQAAELHEHEGRFKQASKLYEHTVSLMRSLNEASAVPDSDLAIDIGNLALCYKRQGEFLRAMELYQESLRLHKTDHTRDNLVALEMRLSEPVTRLRGKGGARVVSDKMKLTEEQGPDAAQRLRKYGNEAFQKRSFDAAIRWYTAAIQAHPDADDAELAKLHCNRAAAYHGLGDPFSMICDATKATELDPEYPKAWFRLGVAHCKQGNYQGGVDALEKASALAPADESIRAEIEDATRRLRSQASTACEVDQISFNKSPIGVIDKRVGELGLEAACPPGTHSRAVHDAYTKWQQGIKACLCLRSIGSRVRAAPQESPMVEGAWGELAAFAHQEQDPLGIVRDLTDAVWSVSETGYACSVFNVSIDGRELSASAIELALQGLAALLTRDDTSWSSELRTKMGRGAIGPQATLDWLAEHVRGTDLTRTASQDKLEATLRVTALFAYVGTNKAGVCLDHEKVAIWAQTHALVQRADDVRRLVLWRALAQFCGLAEVSQPEMLTAAQRLEAVEALRSNCSEAMATAFGTAWPMLWKLQSSQIRYINRMPGRPGVEVSDLTVLVNEATNEWADEEPAVISARAWLNYERAHRTNRDEHFVFMSQAASDYLHAAHSRGPRAAAYDLSRFVVEGANARGLAGGISLGELRAFAAEAAELRRELHGMYEELGYVGQADLALRAVLDKTATRPSNSTLTSAEYTAFVRQELDPEKQSQREQARRARREREAVESSAALRGRPSQTGPRFVAGALPAEDELRCALCQAVSGPTVKLSRCAGCQKVAYCCQDHQRQHWRASHKVACRAS